MKAGRMSLKVRIFKHKFFLVSFFSFLLLLLIVLMVLVFKDKRENKSRDSVHFGDTNVVNSGNKNSLEEKPASDAVNFNVNEQKDVSKTVDSITPTMSTSKDYSHLYPDFCVSRPKEQFVFDKTMYLTFDDGPSERTPEILDILNKYNIKATFFVIGKTDDFSKECMKRIVREGHTIAMHSYTHNFKKIYANVESFLEDMYRLYNLIYETTGVKPSIFRFAGGSRNGFNRGNYKEIIAEMVRRGFDYFDWNLCNNDAVSKKLMPAEKCVENVVGSSAKYNTGVVLMHDAKPKTTTVEALPKIIEKLKEQGFRFSALTHEVCPKSFVLGNGPYA